MATDFLGQGLAFPLRKNSRGGVEVSDQEQKIKESIYMILGTQQGERLMRPTFGCNLKSLIFAPNTKATANLARFYVEESLRTWEPRIIVEEVSVRNDYITDQNNREERDTNVLSISIRYRIKATYEVQNLVYPFYLEQA
ncbi:GPW/gp25 family protein [Nostoc sp. UIC 10607]|uniref:GPW/gp25 family protein n=1 Tax=Nostoc sp. UIC 10607 TaxID=3045935 RepID=UPI0039A35195